MMIGTNFQLPGTSLALAFAAGWSAWYLLVLRNVAKSTSPWGSRSLAILVSRGLHWFGATWMTFSHNAEESQQAGTWEDGKQYVLVWHPHGAFTIAALYFLAHWWAKDFPSGARGRQFVCVAPLLLKIPFLSELLLLCHARSQDRETFGGLLAKGATVAVQPGGLVEQVETDDAKERVFFPARLGFIRLALQAGVPLLPVYAFGENQLYRTSNWTRALNKWLYKKFKCGNLVIIGQFGLPSTPVIPNPLMLPVYRSGMHIRFGDPVDIGPKDENPSDEKVQEAFQKYTDALQKLFDKHKDECLPPEVAARGLEVIVRGENGSKKVQSKL